MHSRSGETPLHPIVYCELNEVDPLEVASWVKFRVSKSESRFVSELPH